MLEKHGKKVLFLLATVLALVATSTASFAAEVIPAGDSSAKAMFAVAAMVAAGFVMGVGAIGVGLGMGSAVNSACQGVSRNPGAHGKIMMTLLVGLAMIESIAIYALVISLVLLFANPYKLYFLG